MRLPCPRSLPEELELAVTPLFNRIAVQLTEAETVLSGTTIEGHVDIRKDGVWHNGTELYRSYGTDDYYANCFNLLEDTSYKLRLTIALRNTTTNEIVKRYVHHFVTRTLSSAAPQQAEGGLEWFVDPVAGQDGPGRGETPTMPYKWLNARSWEAGDTIVIMNGDFSGASTSQRRIEGADGEPDNWIRIVPYSVVDEENGDAEQETFRSAVDLDGTWTDETNARSGVHTGMPGVWSMLLPNNQRLMGHVRDTTSGLELYPHNTFSRAVSTDEPGIKEGWASVAEDKFPDFEPNGPAGFFVDLEHSETVSSQTYWRLYVRTVDGDAPDSGQLVGGYWIGPTIRNCSYLSIEDCAFDGLQNITKTSGSYATGAVNRIGSNGAITLSATDGNDCHDIYLKRCSFTNTYVRFSGTLSPLSRVYNVLVDDCSFHRDGPTEYFFDQRDYSENDPYDALYGYHPIKASIWDGHGGAIFNHANRGQAIVIRNSTFHAYDIYTNPDANNSGEEGKHLDIYGCVSNGIGLADANWSDGPSGIASVNAAIWDCVLSDHAEPIAASPINGGPIWFFACRGDGYLHIPYKIGLQSGDYDTSNGHGFKIIANTSFAGVGFVTSEHHGNMRFQGSYSGLLGSNNVVKGYQAKTGGPWFSTADSFGGEHLVEEGRVNVWKNGVIYILNPSTATGDAARPKLYWNSTTYDPMHSMSPTYPPSEEIVWQDYIFGWSVNNEDDPFPTSTADGLNSAITRKSVYVRGITDLAGDENGNPVALASLPIGYFPLRSAE